MTKKRLTSKNPLTGGSHNSISRSSMTIITPEQTEPLLLLLLSDDVPDDRIEANIADVRQRLARPITVEELFEHVLILARMRWPNGADKKATLRDICFALARKRYAEPLVAEGVWRLREKEIWISPVPTAIDACEGYQKEVLNRIRQREQRLKHEEQAERLAGNIVEREMIGDMPDDVLEEWDAAQRRKARIERYREELADLHKEIADIETAARNGEASLRRRHSEAGAVPGRWFEDWLAERRQKTDQAIAAKCVNMAWHERELRQMNALPPPPPRPLLTRPQ
jgi:hypothetical protein